MISSATEEDFTIDNEEDIINEFKDSKNLSLTILSQMINLDLKMLVVK